MRSDGDSYVWEEIKSTRNGMWVCIIYSKISPLILLTYLTVQSKNTNMEF